MNTIETKSARLSIIHEDGVWYAETQLKIPDSKKPHLMRIIVPFDGLVDLAEYIISEKEKKHP